MSCSNSYKTYNNDPTSLRLYTLENGLQVYLAKNQDEPKIQTYIGVRAGSVYDPADNTGLAHYLEHMLFKGTSKYGTSNWEKEKPLIAQIANLYEDHKAENDPEKKNEIYRKIDSFSYQASKYAIANEYDQMIKATGAEKTNAHTWFEETVYKNIIPTNALEKWLKIESERFSELVLRLFHTELEAVYEEFNRAQDSDWEAQYTTLLKGLFPKHPYGQQTTIGTSEHLKNPSMKAIHAYFEKYYVPNNMAIILVGDIDFETTIQLVEKYFGHMKNQKVIPPELVEEAPLEEALEQEVSHPSPASVIFAYRTGAIGSSDEVYLTIVDKMLYNETAGLIDIELNQKQQVQQASSFHFLLNDYGMHFFYGVPKENQSLQEVRNLIINQIDRIKNGDFEDWMLEAIINNIKVEEVKKYDNATSTADAFLNSFIHFQDWQSRVDLLDKLSKVTKEKVIAFAKKTYKNNYSLVYKKQGPSTGLVKVDKPKITPIQLNTEEKSEFNKEINRMKVNDIEPLFVDYQSAIKQIDSKKKNLRFSFIENPNNDLFTLTYVFDIGKDHIKKLRLAIGYLNFLGTEQYSPEQIQQEFYKLGITKNRNISNRRTALSISGLYGPVFEKAVSLFEHYINSAKADNTIYQGFIQKVIKDRIDEKNMKSKILFDGLGELCLYGNNSRLKNRLSIDEIKAIKPEELVEIVKNLKNYKHEVFYYGRNVDKVASIVNNIHEVAEENRNYPKRKVYEIIESSNQIFFTNYDMVQSEIFFVTKDIPLNIKNLALIQVFNAYFGSGLSSVVFREIREAQALAYAVQTRYTLPQYKDENHVFYGYIGTQANKLDQATTALLQLINNPPEAKKFFESSKQSVLKQIQADRITKANIYWQYKSLLDRGVDYDIRKDVYAAVQAMTFDDVKQFFNKHIKGKTYNYAIIGNEKTMNLEPLKKLGTLHKVDVDYLFNNKK